MKALILAVLLACGLDLAFHHGLAIRSCWQAFGDLVVGTRDEVAGSVYRR